MLADPSPQPIPKGETSSPGSWPEHALGKALMANAFVGLARYEVHLDRKLERSLTMLIRLRDLRRGSSET